MDHVSPPDTGLKVERLSVVWHHSKVKRVLVSFLDQLVIGLLGLLWIELGFPCLQVGVEDEEGGRANEHDHQEEEVLEKQAQQLAGAHLFLLDEQVVRRAALLAIDPLATDDPRRHAV